MNSNLGVKRYSRNFWEIKNPTKKEKNIEIGYDLFIQLLGWAFDVKPSWDCNKKRYFIED